MTWILTAIIGACLGACVWAVGGWVLTSFFLPNWFRHRAPNLLIAEIIQLQPSHSIEQFLLRPQLQDQVDQWLGAQVDQYLTVVVPEKWPMVSLLIGDKTRDKVRQALSDYLRDHWNQNIKSLSREHLTDAQIAQQIVMLSKLDDPTRWTNRFDALLKKQAGWILLFSIGLGAGLSLLGRLIFKMLISN